MVLGWVELYEIGAGDSSGYGVEVSDGFADGHASGFAMRDAWSESGIECVHVEGDVDGALGLHAVEGWEVTHLDHFYSELFCLLALVRIHGANANLNQPLCCAGFHDARKGTGVGLAIAFEFVVEVGMGVEVDDGEFGNTLPEGSNDGQCDGVVAAEADRAEILVEEFSNFLFDGWERFLKMKLEIAGIAVSAGCVEVDAGFSGGVCGVGMESYADDGRRSGGSSKP